MFCPKCARENPDRNKFCHGCGAALAATPVMLPAIVVPPPQPPPPPQKIGSRSETPKNVKPFFNLDAGKKADGKSDEAFSVSDGGKNSSEPPQKQTRETFKNYISEVENKYRAARTAKSANSKIPLIIGAAAVLVILGGFAVVSRFLINKRDAMPVITAENQKTSAEKAYVNQIVPPLSPSSASLPEMIYVAGGEFMMGSDGGDEFSRPAHRVAVKPFYIDKTEVTCEEYKKFIDATGHKPPPAWKNKDFPPGAARKPVTGVNWDDANAFAKWKSKRLPTEEEWEFAARGTDGRIYPWGGEWKPEMANADKQKNGVQEVGLSAGQSPFGVFDLSGNAWEWTSSDAKPYPSGKSFETNSADAKIIRGGFFGSSKDKATTDFRRAWGARSETDYNNTSFRCARDVSAN